MKKLTIGIVVDQLLEGGVQKAAIEEVKGLNKLGHHATLLILMRKSYPTDFSYLVKGVPHRYLSDSYPQPFKRTIKFPIFNFLSTLHLASPLLAPRILKHDFFDILISWGTTTCLTTQAIYKRLHIPYIAVIPDPLNFILDKVYARTYLKYFFPFLKPLASRIERSFVRDALKTMIISNVHADYLKTNYAITPFILEPAINPQKINPNRHGRALLSFGRWDKGKNPNFLLDILRDLPESRLIIAGTWTNANDFQQFRQEIRRRQLTHRVTLIASYTNKKIQSLARQSRLWLYPHFEAFGLAALEAAALGLPIIIPQGSGITEKFTHGVHGFFPKTTTVSQYKIYIEKLLTDVNRATAMGRKAQHIVLDTFSWPSHLNKLLAMISQVLPNVNKIPLAVLEISHASEAYIAGGDLALEKMLQHLPVNQPQNNYLFQISLIIPRLGIQHWEQSGLKIDRHILPVTIFDNIQKPFHIFLAYCFRMWHSFWILLDTVKLKTIYSSTNMLPDILPAYCIKKIRPGTVWIATVHHLISHPRVRPGNIWVNIVSFYFMQKLSLFALKSSCDLILIRNNEIQKELIALGFRKNKMRILGAGIEYEKITQTKPAYKKRYDGIFVGRLHPAKGLDDLIPIWSKVKAEHQAAKLAIIGEGSEIIKTEFQAKLQENNLTQNVDFLGFLPSNELFSVLKQGKVFLFTDHEAGWGVALAEAMACGLPVVGYNLSVFKDVYQQGFVTVPKYNLELFAQNVTKLLNDRDLWKKISQQARRQAKNLSWDKTAKQFYLYVNEAINGTRTETLHLRAQSPQGRTQKIL